MARNILQGFISIISGQLSIFVLSALLTPVLTRLLGVSSYGDYAFIMSVLSIAMIAVNAGVFEGIRKYISENRPIDDWEDQVFATYSRFAFGAIAVSTSVILLSVEIGIIERLFGESFNRYFYLLAIIIILKQFLKVSRSALMGLGFEYYSEPLRVLERIIFLIGAVMLSYFGFGVDGVLIGYIVSTGITMIISFWILRSYLSYSYILKKASSDLPRYELFSFNALSLVLMALSTSLYNVDIVLLQPLAGSAATGQYKVALVAAEFLWLAPASLQIMLLHSTSEMWSNGEYERLTQLAARATRYGLLLTVLLALGMASLADPFLPLFFGQDYNAAILPFLLLLPGALGYALARPIFAIGQGKGSLRILIYATGTSAVINLVLNLLLIPSYGMNGAAVATSIGYGSMFMFHVISARKIGFDPLIDLRASRVLVTAGLSALVIFGLSSLITSDVLSLILVPPVGFITYSVLSLKTHAISPHEIREIVRRLPGPLDRALEALV